MSTGQKAFYEKVGFNRADQDPHGQLEILRFVQLTPPGSPCSSCIGKGLTKVKPGSTDLVLLVIENADKAREELLAKGIEVGEVDEQPWADLSHMIDPDGNKLFAAGAANREVSTGLRTQRWRPYYHLLGRIAHSLSEG
jgi:hypothetical protein